MYKSKTTHKRELSAEKLLATTKFFQLSDQMLEGAIPQDRIGASLKKLSDKYAERSMKIVNNKGKRLVFRKIIKKIQERAESFYKFGFKTYEKQQHRSIFEDVFELKKQRLKGTISIGDLWSNKQSIKFLKENNMFLNKMRLVEELKILKKEIKKVDNAKKVNIKPVFTEKSINTIYSNKRTQKCMNICKQNVNNFGVQNFSNELIQIRKSLRNLGNESISQQNIILSLEKNTNYMKRLQKHYNYKLNLE